MPSPHKLLPDNAFFQINRRLVEREIDSSVTVTFISEVDLTAIKALRESMGSDKPSYTAFVAKAVATALQQYPYANRRVCRRWFGLGGRRLQQFEHSDIAIAAERAIPDAEGVAFVDVIRNVQNESLENITHWLKQLSQADETTNAQWRDFSNLARRFPGWLAGVLAGLPTRIPAMWTRYRGGAVLISSPAKYGVDSVVATWPWPVGVSFGLVKERAVVRHGHVEARPTFNLVLNFDRRIMAGAPAAKFFKAIVDHLENPMSMNRTEHATPPGTAHDTPPAHKPQPSHMNAVA